MSTAEDTLAWGHMARQKIFGRLGLSNHSVLTTIIKRFAAQFVLSLFDNKLLLKLLLGVIVVVVPKLR